MWCPNRFDQLFQPQFLDRQVGLRCLDIGLAAGNRIVGNPQLNFRQVQLLAEPHPLHFSSIHLRLGNDLLWSQLFQPLVFALGCRYLELDVFYGHGSLYFLTFDFLQRGLGRGQLGGCSILFALCDIDICFGFANRGVRASEAAASCFTVCWVSAN